MKEHPLTFGFAYLPSDFYLGLGSGLSYYILIPWFLNLPSFPHLIKPYHLCFVLSCFNNSLDLILWSTAGEIQAKANWVLCNLVPPCSAIFLFPPLTNFLKCFLQQMFSSFNSLSNLQPHYYLLHAKDFLCYFNTVQNIRHFFPKSYFLYLKISPSFQQMAPARKIGKKGIKYRIIQRQVFQGTLQM